MKNCLLILIASALPIQAAPVNYSVPGTVPALKQPYTMACWATAATILMSWKTGSSMQIKDVVAQAGPAYSTLYTSNVGLSGAKKAAFLSALNLQAETPQNFTIQGWADLLKKFGPLWVTSASGPLNNFSVHARIMTKISGDGTPDGTKVTLIDPGTGTEGPAESIKDFINRYEAIAKADLGDGAELRPQVVHFATSQ